MKRAGGVLFFAFTNIIRPTAVDQAFTRHIGQALLRVMATTATADNNGGTPPFIPPGERDGFGVTGRFSGNTTTSSVLHIVVRATNFTKWEILGKYRLKHPHGVHTV